MPPSAAVERQARAGAILEMNLMSLLSQISFGSPIILTALLSLPVLWWLLRVTPPLPRRTLFPPLRLLRGLEDEEQTPAATPWWLLLLRLLAAALLILALADPLLGRTPKLATAGRIFAWLIFIGYTSIPVAVLLHLVKPAQQL